MPKTKKKDSKTQEIKVIKEIKQNIKVKEISKESDLEKDIEESQIEHFGEFISSDRVNLTSTPTLSSNGLPEQIPQDRNIAPTRRANNEQEGVKPYTSSSDSDEKRRSYNPTLDQNNSATLPENRVLNNSANSANPFSSQSLSDEQGQKYSAKEFSPAEQKKPKRYAWDV